MTPRSYLYVPAHREEMLAKAGSRGADAIICDLEDAVPLDRKADARSSAAAWLAQIAAAPEPSAEIWLRINAEALEEDIAATVAPGLTGVSVAKATPQLLVRADEALRAAETRLGLPDGSIPVIPLVETSEALLALPQIASAPRVLRLAIGEADLTAELGMAPSDGEPELLSIRVQLVVVSAAANLLGPVGPVSTDFTDLAALRTSTGRLLGMGFRARSAVHPAQIPVINQAFTPTAEEVAGARSLLRRFEAAGGAATTDESGRMIDLAVIRGARDVLARAGAADRGAPGGTPT